VDTQTDFTPDELPIAPSELALLLRGQHPPLLLDVRRAAAFAASAWMLEGAVRCAPDEIAAFAASQRERDPQRLVVPYCVFGHAVSGEVVSLLRAAGLNARKLAGGFEGGEEGVDAPENIAVWRATPLTRTEKLGAAR
jgi:rhodanese-related sulfurtransferase